MEIGTGIAIAGVWIFAAVMGASRNVSSTGGWISIICAIVVTTALIT